MINFNIGQVWKNIERGSTGVVVCKTKDKCLIDYSFYWDEELIRQSTEIDISWVNRSIESQREFLWNNRLVK